MLYMFFDHYRIKLDINNKKMLKAEQPKMLI